MHEVFQQIDQGAESVNVNKSPALRAVPCLADHRAGEPVRRLAADAASASIQDMGVDQFTAGTAPWAALG